MKTFALIFVIICSTMSTSIDIVLAARDHYATLNLGESKATESSVIKRAFRSAALLLHPDKIKDPWVKL